MWRPLLIRKGSVLKFKSAIKGCRAYLAFAGGIAIPKVMDSKSTYLRAGIGGLQGRALQKGDTLECGDMNELSHSFVQQLDKMNGQFYMGCQLQCTNQFKSISNDTRSKRY